MARKNCKEMWIDRRCCDWDMFLFELIGTAYQMKFPLLLVNWCQARRYWRRYSCTGAEVIKIQRAREINETLYNGYGEPPSQSDNLGDDLGLVMQINQSSHSFWWKGSMD
ncbi:hypothetical protein [Pseudomonas fluorescens]|uniref:Uncharacterized protein n=1 Tax=Pseudomonas fluorescens TaxID=294 RepID=A0A5E7QFI1_PSEFL|nr:hypothetical protein [Pseudomonas fluorescens]VVP60584.1 hypothetical protein PS880_06173 [Pseudomonas fluorescens]